MLDNRLVLTPATLLSTVEMRVCANANIALRRFKQWKTCGK
jgi:hypothetical protein